MSDDRTPTNLNRLRQAWVEALLLALRPESQEERIAELLKRLEAPEVTGTSGLSNRISPQWMSRWKPMAIAATILIAAFIGYQVSIGNPVHAAVTRSLEAISRHVTYQYDLNITFVDSELGEYTISSEVYVRGRDSFVIRRRGIAADIWLGCNGNGQHWLIQPGGYIRRGEASELYRWFDARWDKLKYPRPGSNPPFLHVASALELMYERCQLSRLPDEAIRLADGQELWCEHILGVPETPRIENPPQSIDLWISEDFDIPIQVVAQWDVSVGRPVSAATIQSIQLIYRGQPEVAEDWFEAESHLGRE
jgi:hypothetical protein